nr:hypothetical protein [Jiangella muralis]
MGHAPAPAPGHLPGDQHHQPYPAGGAEQPGMLEQCQQDDADGGQLPGGPDGGNGQVPGEAEALVGGRCDGYCDQQHRGRDLEPGHRRGAHWVSG